ncbi:hypothetical protein [Chryseobacterium indoltheticum]|uniref:hypothetical protein n=1 Tax=Chryseobacterium indoltheticum TaxID=254 RepID=UPI003F497C61
MLGFTANAQTTLAAGDIAFTSYDSSPLSGNGDKFSFVLLTNISAGTTISFTDREYNGSGWQTAGGTESAITWVSGTAIPMGTEVYIVGLVASTYNPLTSTSTPNGSVTLTDGSSNNGLSLANTGDQIIAFQGGNGAITGSGAYCIAGINYMYHPTGTTSTAGWNAGAPMGPNSSLMPPRTYRRYKCVLHRNAIRKCCCRIRKIQLYWHTNDYFFGNTFFGDDDGELVAFRFCRFCLFRMSIYRK